MEKISLFDPHLTVASQISIGTKKPSPHCASALFALARPARSPAAPPNLLSTAIVALCVQAIWMLHLEPNPRSAIAARVHRRGKLHTRAAFGGRKGPMPSDSLTATAGGGLLALLAQGNSEVGQRAARPIPEGGLPLPSRVTSICWVQGCRRAQIPRDNNVRPSPIFISL